MHGRRVSDRQPANRRQWQVPFFASPACLRAVTWEDQRSQFLARYLFWLVGLAYFNLGGTMTRSPELLVGVNLVHAVYVVLTTLYLLHAWGHSFSPLRWRIAMWTDITAVSFTALADANVASPAYLVFLAIILGNGMRYGLRPFGEAAFGSFLFVVLVLFLRFTDYLNALSVAGLFFLLFGAIVVMYSYTLLARLERQRQHMVTQSNLDTLTGLLNRRGLTERSHGLFGEVRSHNRPLSVLFADLDGFKGINDALGHHVGDTVLRKVAGLINASIRDSDVAARYGGDEFVVIMPDTSLAQATLVAERLQAAVGQWARDGALNLSLSIGMGEAPGHGAQLDDLLRRVDSAMYLCKQSYGRGGIRCVDDVPAT
jgi:diguanylate cyclase (GGDEF)-like protein